MARIKTFRRIGARSVQRDDPCSPYTECRRSNRASGEVRTEDGRWAVRASTGEETGALAAKVVHQRQQFFTDGIDLPLQCESEVQRL